MKPKRRQIKITFVATGESVLKLFLQSPEGATTELGASSFFHD